MLAYIEYGFKVAFYNIKGEYKLYSLLNRVKSKKNQ